MASASTTTVVMNNVTLTAGAARTTTASTDTTATHYGGFHSIKFTNGATGPTAVPEFQLQYSPDDSNWFNDGDPLEGTDDNYAAGPPEVGVSAWAVVPLRMGARYWRAIVGGNTDEDVTVRWSITYITAI